MLAHMRTRAMDYMYINMIVQAIENVCTGDWALCIVLCYMYIYACRGDTRSLIINFAGSERELLALLL